MSLLSEALYRIEKAEEKKREEKAEEAKARLLSLNKRANALELFFPELTGKRSLLCDPVDGSPASSLPHLVRVCGHRWQIEGRHGMISINMLLDAPSRISIVREGPSRTLDKHLDFTPNMECVSQQATIIAHHIAMLMTLAEMPPGSCVG